jgi:uncharacterized protein with beta-barrel porin domain
LTVFAVSSGSPADAQGVPPPTCAVSPIDGSVVNCTGNQSTGIELNDGAGPFKTLNVFALTTNIVPASGTAGIEFTSDGGVELNVDTGAFGISTTGDNASGVFAGSANGDVAIRTFANIITTGNLSHGIAADSDGGDINILARGTIQTSGDAIGALDGAFGIAATSLSGDITIVSAANITTTGIQGAGIFADTTGIAIVDSSGSIITRGEGAAGIAAAGETGAAVISTGSITTEGFEAPGITVISDAEVGVVMSGSITTGDDSSRGIWAQSLVNGMVAVGAGGTITTAGTDSDGIWARSLGGAVVVISSADITTTGQLSDGISAISGAALATVINFGGVSANGFGSAGIFADGQDTQVENYGTVIGGPCCGGVMMAADNLASLRNFGTIIGQPSGEAIFGSGTDVRIENFGTVTGNVMISGASSALFFNNAGALFNAGEQVFVSIIGTGGAVINDGTIAPGGRGSVVTTAMSDNYSQGAGGKYAVDLDPQASSFLDRNDYIAVSNNAEVAGVVEVSLLSLPIAASETFIILTGMNSLTDNGLSLIASPALHATLFSDSTNVILGISVDFATDRLNPNQRAIAADLTQIFLAGGGGVTPVLLGLLNTGSFDAYKDALNQLSPEIYSNAEIAALYSSLAFSNSLLSCKVNGAGTASIIREGQCLWAGASATFLDTGTTTDQIGFTQTAGLFNAGAQAAIDDVWRIGFGAGYQSSSLQTATNAQSDGSLAQAGLSVKYNPGPLLLAGAISGGGAWYDTTRPMAFGGFTGVAEGEQDIGIVSGSLRAAYVLGSPHLYYKPILDLGLTHLELGGFTESGGGGAALTVAGGGQTVFSLAPMLEVGSEWWMSNGTLIRPMIRGGAIWYDGADFALTAAFAGAPLGVSPFTINTDIDEVMGLVGAGVEVINGGDAVLRFNYDGQLGETTQIHTVGVKGSARF